MSRFHPPDYEEKFESFSPHETFDHHSQWGAPKHTVYNGGYAPKQTVYNGDYGDRASLADYYARKMRRGAISFVIGCLVTFGSLAFAQSTGGFFIVAFGAIIFGLINFFTGLVGYLNHR